MATRTIVLNVGSRKQSGQYVMSQSWENDVGGAVTGLGTDIGTISTDYAALLANATVATAVATGTPATLAAAVTTDITAATAAATAAAASSGHIVIIFNPAFVTAGALAQAGHIAATMAAASGVDP